MFEQRAPDYCKFMDWNHCQNSELIVNASNFILLHTFVKSTNDLRKSMDQFIKSSNRFKKLMYWLIMPLLRLKSSNKFGHVMSFHCTSSNWQLRRVADLGRLLRQLKFIDCVWSLFFLWF